MQQIITNRLILRDWQTEDLEPFAAMNQDVRVMQYYPSTLSLAETKTYIEKITAHLKQHGFGLYACALQDTNEFIGYVGLNIPSFNAHFTPCVEIGWRIAFQHWGKGYAPEAARAVLKIGFENFNLNKIVSFTAKQNMRSRRVMEKLGMEHNPAEDFHHPNLPPDHALSLHALYRLKKSDWIKTI